MPELDDYSRYFPLGSKVGVGIPLPNAEVFRDWAIIHEIDEDLISLQLSRDVLPTDVNLNFGQILEIRGGKEGAGYCCRAIIVSEGDARELLLRLIGEVVSDELREFYRIDAFLPIKYYISSEQHIEILHKQWQERLERRRQAEQERREQRWDSAFVQANADLPQERHLKKDDAGRQEQDDSWDTIIPLAANISGGGMRLITHQDFENGDYVLLEIMVPYPRRIVDAVARVVFANPNLAVSRKPEYFNTGLQFVFIDERDRDAIVKYISNVQLKRIRQLREKYIFRDSESFGEALTGTGGPNRRQVLVWILSSIMFLVVTALLFLYFRNYAQDHPKGEIEQIFEGGLKRYLDNLK